MIFSCSNFRCILVPFMQGYIWVLIYLESIVQQVSCSNPPLSSANLWIIFRNVRAYEKRTSGQRGWHSSLWLLFGRRFLLCKVNFGKKIWHRYRYVYISHFSGTKLQTRDKHSTGRSKLRQCFSQQFSKPNFKVFLYGKTMERHFLLCKLYSSWISLLFLFDK